MKINYTLSLLLALCIVGSCTKDIEPIAASASAINATSTNGVYQVGTAIRFDAYALNATSYKWSFGDGTTSTEATPSKIYSQAGTYTVLLTAIGSGGSAGTKRSITILPAIDFNIVGGDCEATCSVDVLLKNASGSIVSSLSSVGVEQLSWAWGDGTSNTTTTTTTATHAYTQAGTYTITLSAKYTGSVGFSVISGRSVTIKVPTAKVTHAWSMGGTDYDYGEKIVTDKAGNVYVAGEFYGSATFGNQTLNTPNSTTIFLTKYNNTGSLLWVKTISFYTQANYVADLAISSLGNIYLAYYSSNNSGSYAGVFTKIDTNGNIAFTKSFINDADINCIGLDANENIYIGGSFYKSLDKTYTVAANESNRGFVLKYNSSGTLFPNPIIFNSNQTLTTTTTSSVEKLTIANDNSLYITGTFKGSYGIGTTKITAVGTNTFLSKFDANFNLQWAKQDGIGNTNSNYASFPYDIITDNGNNPFVLINTNPNSTAINFGTQSLSNRSAGYGDGYIAKFGNDGSNTFLNYASTAWLGAFGLAKDTDGNIVIADVRGVAKITSTGSNMLNNLPLFTFANTADYGSILDIAIDVNNNIFVTGYFNGILTTSITTQTLTSKGNNDIFVLRYGK